MKLKSVNRWRILFEVFLVGVIIVQAVILSSHLRKTTWYENVVHSIPTKEKVVALTYDDGPHPVYTPEILATLKKYHIKATFFMIGKQMERYPEIVKDVLAQGHEIANHTYTHPANIEADTSSQVIRELEKCEILIEKMGGTRAYLFRPPRGLIDSTVYRIAQDEGYRTILWTVSADHHDAPTPEQMAQRVFNLNHPGGIVLLHDGTFASRWKDVAATPLIIEGLKKKGYRFVTVSELLKKGARLRINLNHHQ